MDAMQKRRMWKVAIGHFLLSILFLVIVLNYGFVARSYSGGYNAILEGESRAAWMEAWANLWQVIFSFFQPQFWLINKFVQHIQEPRWLLIPVFLITIPIWSLCFSRIFSKFDNWLNHFPVLGKRVF
jgi:hypothetical protein